MRATIELVNDINKFSEINLVDDVYADSVPVENSDGANQTLIVVMEAISLLDTYGNNTFNEVSQTLKINIYYGLNFKDDTQVFEILFFKFLESIGWRVESIQPTYFEGTTGQAVRVFNVTRLKAIEV